MDISRHLSSFIEKSLIVFPHEVSCMLTANTPSPFYKLSSGPNQIIPMQRLSHCLTYNLSSHLFKSKIGNQSFRPHLPVSGYPCKHILLKTFTPTIYTKTPKTHKRMWILRKWIPKWILYKHIHRSFQSLLCK